VPYQALPAADGWLTVAVGNDAQFRRFTEVLGLPDLADDGRYATNSARVAHRAELVPQLEEVLVTRTRAEWLAGLTQAGVPAASVNTLPEALQDEQLTARGMVAAMEHGTIGSFPMIQSPYGPSLGGAVPRRAPPRHGEHTRELLAAELGLDAAEIDRLVAAGAVSG